MREYFFYFMLFMFLLANIYTVIKLSHHLPFIKRSRVGKILLLLMGFLYIITRVYLNNCGRNIFVDFLSFIGGLYLGFLNYMFFTFILIDTYYLIKKIFKIKNKIKDKTVYRIGIAFTVIVVFLSFLNTLIPTVTKYNIKTTKEINKNLKIVAISDIHLANISISSYLNGVVNKINKMNPDIIIIAGDIIDIDANQINQEKYREILKRLKSVKGVYAVTGNHEYYGNLERNKKFIESCNIKLLSDETINVEDIIIAGREDKHNWYRKGLKEILKNEDKSKFILLMEHNPSKLEESIQNGIDLQISGHTHNGQFFPWNIPTGYMYENSKGILRKGKSTIIVSTGICGWGPMIRNFSRPEILEINIEK